MKLSVRALAITTGLFWGLAVFIVSLFNLMQPSYGTTFLDVISSIYPGYHAGAGFSSIIIGTLYGLLDGTIGGAIFAWIYNFFSEKLK